MSLNFSQSFYKDFIKYLKIQQTSSDSSSQEICTVATLLNSRKSPGRMVTVKSIIISVWGPHGQREHYLKPREGIQTLPQKLIILNTNQTLSALSDGCSYN